jgi:hypothetical protein
LTGAVEEENPQSDHRDVGTIAHHNHHGEQ